MNRNMACAVVLFVMYGCASSTTTQPQMPDTEVLHGIASWYGEEFAGRTTANGEIFDPMLLTAAHRTLPFGTVVDIRNAKTSQSVRVRINDRGPYIGNRVIDLSYAAAQQISLIEPGSGDVDITVVKLGRGDREPPAPYVVTVPEPKEKMTIASSEPPAIEIPIPGLAPGPTAKPAPPEPVVVDRVEVVEQHGGVDTRRQVSADGKTIETVEVATLTPTATPTLTAPAPRPPRIARKSGQFIVQVGAFSVEANAKALQQRLGRIGQDAWVDKESLYRVRIGPFATRDQAMKARGTLEANGISAIIVSE